MADLSAAAPSAPSSRLPARWADALAPHARGPAGAGPSLAPATGEDFDSRLDAFLDGVTARLVAARAAKDEGGGHVFRTRMREVREMWEAEGEDLHAALEARYPGFAEGIGGEGGRGEAEVVDGIRRLEMCLQEEEARRRKRRERRQQGTGRTAVLDGGYKREPDRERDAASPVSLGSRPQSTSPRTMHSDETLCLMQSDIQALKLELLRLQRSKASEPGVGSDRTRDNVLLPTSVGSGARSYSSSHHHSHIPRTSSTVTPPSNMSSHGSAPRYVSHLEHMQSRLDALERRPLPPPSRTGRSKSAVRVGRVPPPVSSMGAGSLSAARLQAHRRKSSASGFGDGGVDRRETAFVKQPEDPRSLTGKVAAEEEPAQEPQSVSVVKTIGEEGFASPDGSNESDSPSPVAGRRAMSRTFSVGANDGAPKTPSVKGKLFSIDAPEDMLSRPQSFAAARDIQRYSLKVAQRLGPVPVEDNSTHAAPASELGSGVSHSGIPKPRTIPSEERVAPSRMEDTVLATFSMSPTRESARPGMRRMVSVDQARAATQQKKVSDTAVAVAAARVAEARVAAAAAAASSVTGYSKAAVPSVQQTETPSTIDTTTSAGSNGPVVEEMEGDIWVRKGSLWKRWRKRYASIVSHKFFGRVLCLFSYDASGAVISSRSEIIVLSGALCRSLRDPLEINGVEQFVFILRTGKEYYFASGNDSERRAWVRELRQAARSSAPVTTSSDVASEADESAVGVGSVAGVPITHFGVVPSASDKQDGNGQENIPPPSAPVVRKASGLVSRKSAIGIGRSVTHLGTRRPTLAQSSGITTETTNSQHQSKHQHHHHRWGPFRRPSGL